MKKILLTLAIVLASYCSYAQSPIYTTAGSGANYNVDGTYLGWNTSTGGGETNLIDNIGGGDVGGFTFDLARRSNVVTRLMTILGSGSIGIGTKTPQALLDVGKPLNSGDLASVLARLPEGNATGSGTYLGIRAYDTQTSQSVTDIANVKSFAIEHSFYGVTNSSINFLRGAGQGGGSIAFNTFDNTEKMRINGAGNLLIGKSSQVNTGYKLDVAGNIRADQITVNTTGADFVFDKNYQLNSLAQTEAFINLNHHLPQIPSAEEMQKDGVKLGELNIKLLQKIEELTLYLIEKDKQLKDQASKSQQQDTRIAAMEKALSKLTKDKG